MARVNGVNAPECGFLEDNVVLSEVTEKGGKYQSGYTIISNEDQNENIEQDEKNFDGGLQTTTAGTTKRYYLTDIIKSRILLRSFLILAFCWYVNLV